MPPEPWPTWPEPVIAYLRGAHGEPSSIERLGGMSVASVHRVRFADTSVIVKSSPRPAESLFYERIAPQLREAAVPIPTQDWVGHVGGGHWLVLEDIPAPFVALPPDRWQPDPRVVAVLTRLHRTTRDIALDFPESPPHHWTDHATQAALACFPADVAGTLAPLLQAYQSEAARLVDGWCWISGDASPPNWGVRTDGSLALFDWELFRPGVPASDLAPAVPGLPMPEHFGRMAAAYVAEWQRKGDTLPWSPDELARDIAVAKVATVVMLLCAYQDGTARVPDDFVARLVEIVPPWLTSLSQATLG
jgi:hypothetical protein